MHKPKTDYILDVSDIKDLFTAPPLIRSVLIEGFTVIGWVVLWRPIELILNEWTSLKMEVKIFQHLLKSNISVRAFTWNEAK